MEEDLAEKMVFVEGPRQVGKTTLSLSLLGPKASAASPAYLTWDSLEGREKILAGRLPTGGSRRGPRFENLVASHLLKYCHAIEDAEGHAMELRFIRDTDKREVDFVVIRDGRPEFAVECKTGEREPAPACRYFRERTDIPVFYQVHCGSRDEGDAWSGTRIVPFDRFCTELQLP